MRKRTKARECALTILYQIEITREPFRELIRNHWQTQEDADKSVKDFTMRLVEGTIANLKQIDKTITSCATNWELKRMAVIDRNILRMAAFEIIFLDDIPVKVAINEAVDLAKKFGDVDSGRFVNGIVDKIKDTSLKEKK